MLDVSANDIALIVGCFTVGLLHGVFGLYSGLFALIDEFKDYKWWSVFSSQFRKKYMARARQIAEDLIPHPRVPLLTLGAMLGWIVVLALVILWSPLYFRWTPSLVGWAVGLLLVLGAFEFGKWYQQHSESLIAKIVESTLRAGAKPIMSIVTALATKLR